jgi:hypothetical protein
VLNKYKTINVKFETDNGTEEVKVPFSIQLMEEMEDMYQSISELKDYSFFRMRKEEKNIHKMYVDFAKRFVDIDPKASPDFPVLFFSSVLASYLDSMKNYSELVAYMTQLGVDSAKKSKQEKDQK